MSNWPSPKHRPGHISFESQDSVHKDPSIRSQGMDCRKGDKAVPHNDLRFHYCIRLTSPQCLLFQGPFSQRWSAPWDQTRSMLFITIYLCPELPQQWLSLYSMNGWPPNKVINARWEPGICMHHLVVHSARRGQWTIFSPASIPITILNFSQLWQKASKALNGSPFISGNYLKRISSISWYLWLYCDLGYKEPGALCKPGFSLPYPHTQERGK